MNRLTSSINTIFFSVLLVLVSLAVAVTLTEITLRSMSSDGDWRKTLNANILRDFEHKYRIDNLYAHQSNTADYHRNEFGLRDRCSDVSQIDILTVGGSTVDQRYVPLDYTFQSILEDEIRSVNKDFGCVSNAGIDGHTTIGHIFAFKHWFPLIPELKPKLILFYIGINDAKFNISSLGNASYDFLDETTIKGKLKKLYVVQDLLPLYRFAKVNLFNEGMMHARHQPIIADADEYTQIELHPETRRRVTVKKEAFRTRVRLLLEQAKYMGATTVCITQPHRYVLEIHGERLGIAPMSENGFGGLDYDYSLRALNAVLREECRPYVLDLFSHSFNERHFYDSVHTTASGSAEIGRTIFSFLEHSDLIDAQADL